MDQDIHLIKYYSTFTIIYKIKSMIKKNLLCVELGRARFIERPESSAEGGFSVLSFLYFIFNMQL